MAEHSKLEEGALGLVESVVMGVAGTAPGFSIAATTTTLIAAVGVLSVASLFYCGLIMFGVTFAFMHLNRVITNAGASYAWVGQVFHPVLGFLAGWALLVASAVFMVSGTIPAATATLVLIAPKLASNPGAVTFVAAGWLLLVGAVIVKGIKPTSYTQVVMTDDRGRRAGGRHRRRADPVRAPARARRFSGSGCRSTAFTPQLFATGALTSLFFFWGWDVTLNLNEETRDAAKAPGHGAVIAMVIVLLLFMCFALSTLLVLSDAEIEQVEHQRGVCRRRKTVPRSVELHGRDRRDVEYRLARWKPPSCSSPAPCTPRAATARCTRAMPCCTKAGVPPGSPPRDRLLRLAAAVPFLLLPDDQFHHQGFGQRHRLPSRVLLQPGRLRLRLAFPPQGVYCRRPLSCSCGRRPAPPSLCSSRSTASRLSTW